MVLSGYPTGRTCDWGNQTVLCAKLAAKVLCAFWLLESQRHCCRLVGAKDPFSSLDSFLKKELRVFKASPALTAALAS